MYTLLLLAKNEKGKGHIVYHEILVYLWLRDINIMVKRTNNSQKSKKKEPTVPPPSISKSAFPVVGIGASAGGLEALEQLFINIPPKSGMAYVVIQHLDPHHKGILPELLQRKTSMEVVQVVDNLKVKPDTVYVIPPNKSMSVIKRVLHLFDPLESRGLRLPIDFFFRSLALDLGDKAVGIILSGMGSDGALGLKPIKENHGLVLVQSPESAKFDGMPKSAIESVVADITDIPAKLPARLIALLKILPEGKLTDRLDDSSISNIDKVVLLLREYTGHDFSMYKRNTLFRRIERRKGVHQIDKLNAYVRLLQENPKEAEILFRELLIGVTSFFRDHDVWDFLRDSLFPDLFKKLPSGYQLRAWIPACSTGEEAFSLAIIFMEALEKLNKARNISLQIFATDLDSDAIDRARKAVFSNNIVADVSPERLTRFFTVEDKLFRLNPSIRNMVVFAPQNVIADPPFTRIDLLSCRNLLIYLEPALQKKVISLFRYSLNPSGILMLGTAETIGVNKEGFDDLDLKYKIFKKTDTVIGSNIGELQLFSHKSKDTANIAKSIDMTEDNIASLADQILLQRFSPASVLVNTNGDIIYITGKTGKYLEPVAGKANWNIHAMARDGLRQVLPGAFRKAATSYEPVFIPKVRLGTEKSASYIDVTVQRIEKPDSIQGMIMVVFKDNDTLKEKSITTDNKRSSPKAYQPERIKEMELELQRSYEELQSTREEMQTSQEELKSTNEELQSTNEELQSTNEELTTSKEEMQSLNEELQTSNIELQSKIVDYVRASDDMKNLLNSTEIATLFLDKDLNIRRFTDHIVSIFKLRDGDIGRPFTELVNDLTYPDIENDARQVLKTLTTVERAISTRDDRWFNIRIMPYRTIDDRIDGLVLTFTNISVSKKLEHELKKLNDELRVAGKK